MPLTKTLNQNNPNNVAILGWDVDVTSATDYYAFGMAKSGRSFVASSKNKYRYGFNTQERNYEIYGKGNRTTAMFWQYNTRLGRSWVWCY